MVRFSHFSVHEFFHSFPKWAEVLTPGTWAGGFWILFLGKDKHPLDLVYMIL
jgi:hypothetical protein